MMMMAHDKKINKIHKIDLFNTLLINQHTGFLCKELTYKEYINLWIKLQIPDK